MEEQQLNKDLAACQRTEQIIGFIREFIASSSFDGYEARKVVEALGFLEHIHSEVSAKVEELSKSISETK